MNTKELLRNTVPASGEPQIVYNLPNPSTISVVRTEYVRQILQRGEVPATFGTYGATLTSPETLEKFLAALLAANGGQYKVVAKDISLHPITIFSSYVFLEGRHDFLLVIDGDEGVSFTTIYHEENNKDFYNLLKEVVFPFFDDQIDEAKIYVIEENDFGLRIVPFGLPIGVPFFPSHYTEKCVKGYSEISENIKSDTPPGKLIILQGDPGTGKTYFIRHLIHDLMAEAYFVILPLDLLPGLSGSKFTRFISKNIEKWKSKPIVFILEDAEMALATREGDNSTMVSTMLNWTEGLTSASVNIRIIASTNADFKDYDKALLRPGRLGTSLKFEKLPKERAQLLLLELSPSIPINKVQELISMNCTLAEVYQEHIQWEKMKKENEDLTI